MNFWKIRNKVINLLTVCQSIEDCSCHQTLLQDKRHQFFQRPNGDRNISFSSSNYTLVSIDQNSTSRRKKQKFPMLLLTIYMFQKYVCSKSTSWLCRLVGITARSQPSPISLQEVWHSPLVANLLLKHQSYSISDRHFFCLLRLL